VNRSYPWGYPRTSLIEP